MKRKAEDKDLNQVYEIYMHEKVNPYLLYDPMSLEQFAVIYQREIGLGSWYVYEQDNTVVGFYKITRFEGKCEHIAQIGNLAVSPECFGTGVASELMKDLLDGLRSEGVERIELIVECDNPRAISFYERFGFQKEGILQKYCRRGTGDYVDDFMMALLVDA